MEGFVIYVLSLLCIDSMCLAKSLNCTKIMKSMILKYFLKILFLWSLLGSVQYGSALFSEKLILSRAGESSFLAS